MDRSGIPVLVFGTSNASQQEMNTVNLTHIIYASIAASAFDAAELKALLQKIRVKNSERGITGMLLYTSGSFFQVLEGEDTTLADLFAKIAADPRHKNVTKIIQEPITRRDFSDWTMGYGEFDSKDLASIEGLGDCFQRGNFLVDLPPGRAKKLLTAFGEGRWRARVKSA